MDSINLLESSTSTVAKIAPPAVVAGSQIRTPLTEGGTSRSYGAFDFKNRRSTEHTSFRPPRREWGINE